MTIVHVSAFVSDYQSAMTLEVRSGGDRYGDRFQTAFPASMEADRVVQRLRDLADRMEARWCQPAAITSPDLELAPMEPVPPRPDWSTI